MKLVLSLFFCLTLFSPYLKGQCTMLSEEEVAKINERPLDLNAKKAQLVGDGVGVQEGFIRNWNKTGSGPEWTLKVPSAGKYQLFLYQACPEGGKLAIMVNGKESVVFDVPKTKGFHDFQTVLMGEVELPQGDCTIQLLCKELKGAYLMDIKAGILAKGLNVDLVNKMLQVDEKKIAAFIEGEKTFHDAIVKAKALSNDLFLGDQTDKVFDVLRGKYPHQAVWIEQDLKEPFGQFIKEYGTSTEKFDKMADHLVSRMKKPEEFQKAWAELKAKNLAPNDPQWLAEYEKGCYARRGERLVNLKKMGNEIIFAKHYVLASVSNIYLITETEGSPLPSALCKVDLSEEKDGKLASTQILFDPGEGMVRDPELSFDAKRLLFAMKPTKKHFDSTWTTDKVLGEPEANYQIYEMNLETKDLRPLTDTTTYGSSFEPCYLPNGDIMFSSARIVQHITCGWGDCSNMFIMNKDGKYARRVGFDQTQTAFPALLDDGRVIFTRRDYNDRGQTSAHALFQMNPDGTGQTEYYGNQTGTPNSFQHARQIPNSKKVICILGGYHTSQGGKLGIIDTSLGRQKDEGAIVVPGHTKPPCSDGIDDWYGKQGEQFSNPRAINEKEYVVSIAPDNSKHYALYYLTDEDDRELLAQDPQVSCLQAVVVAPRNAPPPRPSLVDYRKDDGVMYVQNVYFGQGAEGIKPGTIKKMRVIEILYKNSTTGFSTAGGPGGALHTVTPTGHGLASFDSKRIIGDADVYEDGSAMFYVPARKPIYVQLLDEKNRVVQTMRSWATLMPNEKFSCIGCHEDKNLAPMNEPKRTMAFTKGPQKLKEFYGAPRAFNYVREVQPVLDKHCISCHKTDGKAKKLVLTYEPAVDDTVAKKRFARSYYELTKARPENAHKPEEFYLSGQNPVWQREGPRKADEPNKYVSWWTRFELMKPYPPYRSGSVKSGIIKMLEEGHNGVKLSPEEWDKLCAWIDMNIPYAGEYDEENIFNTEDFVKYRERAAERRRNEEIESRNIREFISDGQP